MQSQGPQERSDTGGGTRADDARAGESHPRTKAARAASSKLDRKTFLGDHTAPHEAAQSNGNVWSIIIHDFGKQWVEMTWGKVETRSGKIGEKGRSRNREHNEIRACARARGAIRKKCLAIGATHLVTLTYRANVEDRNRVLDDLERLRRALKRAGHLMPYVAVLECQERGALHPHLAVRGFQDVRLLRRCWYKIVGNGQGQVNVRGPRPGSSSAKLARYLSKYITKDLGDLPREFEEHRYFSSQNIHVPSEKFQIVIGRYAKEVEEKVYRLVFCEVLRRVGSCCRITPWVGGGGAFGWISGFEDPSHHWAASLTCEVI
jgi:hypothetical protein